MPVFYLRSQNYMNKELKKDANDFFNKISKFIRLMLPLHIQFISERYLICKGGYFCIFLGIFICKYFSMQYFNSQEKLIWNQKIIRVPFSGDFFLAKQRFSQLEWHSSKCTTSQSGKFSKFKNRKYITSFYG